MTAGEPPSDLTEFPSATLTDKNKLVRIHKRPPIYFGSNGMNRYDHPRLGTCYFAESNVGALLEVARGLTVIGPDWLEDRKISSVRVGAPIVIADTTHPKAYAHGYTLTVSAGGDYGLGAEWAEALAEHGFDGLRYKLRHDTTASETGVAVFGTTAALGALTGGSWLTEPLTPAMVALSKPFGVKYEEPLPGDDPCPARGELDSDGNAQGA